jgi:hypothetical protein
LGVPVSGNKLHIKDWLFLDEKLSERLDGWQGASLSYGGRLTLINACLSSIPTYAMSMYLLPKTVIKKMDRTRKRFFWQGGSIKKKYHLVKWMVVTRPKKGGSRNKRSEKNEFELVMQMVVESRKWRRYVAGNSEEKNNINGIVQLKNKPCNSPVWNDLIEIKELYLNGRTIQIGNGKYIDF